MEKINQLITDIVNHVLARIPAENWMTASLNVLQINKMISFQAFYEIGEEYISFDPEGEGIELTMKLKALRKEMYFHTADQGAWFTAYFTIEQNGHFQTHFDYEEKPEFTYEPSREKYMDDLKKFPREESSLPIWLKEIIAN